MHKVTTLLALLCFLWVQAAVVLHVADYGHSDHEHEGKQCEICIFYKHSDAINSSDFNLQPYITSQSLKINTGYISPVNLFQGDENPPRAPPILSYTHLS